MDYSPQQLVSDIEEAGARPRIFDTYILPPFLLWYAVKSNQMPKNLRRILFSAGVWAFYRNFSAYRQAVAQAKETV